MGLLPLTYRRPDYVSETTFKRNESTVQLDEKADASVRSGRSGAPAGIPDALTFDKIINGGTCPVSSFLRGYSIKCSPSSTNITNQPSPAQSEIS
ncbi:hypothetical protein NPX13_g9951 [Xylaria arbuscula]|uniref:Uncharacterized protein n=1 Tax=Xylaria arbuscula TaxID=114810 RepID=A0A9W8TH09_9PEZI|nr:hypothetical protein NPX13_g9951 [Xylaria arbuscula]